MFACIPVGYTFGAFLMRLLALTFMPCSAAIEAFVIGMFFSAHIVCFKK
jgi:hypothetical protein